jgi:hypothetical protein
MREIISECEAISKMLYGLAKSLNPEHRPLTPEH